MCNSYAIYIINFEYGLSNTAQTKRALKCLITEKSNIFKNKKLAYWSFQKFAKKLTTPFTLTQW